MDIQNKRLRDEFESLCKELKNITDNNPKYWSNNKRKYHGLPMRRRPQRQLTKADAFRIYKTQLFNLIEQIIDETLISQLSNEDFFDQFVDIKKFNQGHRVEFKPSLPYYSVTTSTYKKPSSKFTYVGGDK